MRTTVFLLFAQKLPKLYRASRKCVSESKDLNSKSHGRSGRKHRETSRILFSIMRLPEEGLVVMGGLVHSAECTKVKVLMGTDTFIAKHVSKSTDLFHFLDLPFCYFNILLF